jgi:2-methylcitrate dehydratase PrpD
MACTESPAVSLPLAFPLKENSTMPRHDPLALVDPMDIMCRVAAETDYEDLPDEVVDCAKKSVLDTIAVTMGGSAMDAVSQVTGLIRSKGGAPESRLPFLGGKLPASEVALALGTMARAMDYGQVHVEAAHCSEYIVPALVAATGLTAKTSGKEFIAAFAVGQEILIRIGMASKLVSKALTSGHVCFGGYNFGATAAVGKLLAFSQDQLINAQGITAARAIFSSKVTVVPVTHLMRLQHGFICQDAINACLLTIAGITGPSSDILAPPDGYFSLVTWENDFDVLTKGLGERWEMSSNIYTKWHTGCLCTHAAVDGILGQMSDHGFDASAIAAIHVELCPVNWWGVAFPVEMRWHPQSAHECQFSLPYVISYAAHEKAVPLDAYSVHSMSRADIREMMTRITATEDKSLPAWASRIHTTLRDGRSFTREVTQFKGHPRNPLHEEELIAKFKKCASYSAFRPIDARLSSVIDAILNLEDVQDVASTIVLPLTPRQAQSPARSAEG